MRRVLIYFIVLCIVFLGGCAGNGGELNELPINLDINQIERIEFGSIKTYFAGDNDSDIAEFVELFNSSTKYTDDAGTTHPCMIIIYLIDNSTIEVWSGTQGFLTIGDSNTQINIKNDELENYINNIGNSD